MSKSAFTIKVFGVYLLVLGILLALVPNLLLSPFGIPPTNEVWIRVVGVVVINVGVYYWYAAVSEAKPFFLASVFTRAFVLLAFAAFAVLGLAKPMLIAFGAVDALGGLWTYFALRSERTRA
jgi:hypothetical protein